MKNLPLIRWLILYMLASWLATRALAGLGLAEQIVAPDPPPAGCFPLANNGSACPLWLDARDFPGVLRAAADLQSDIQRVANIIPSIGTTSATPAPRPVIIGTLGRSANIDALAAAGKIDASALAGKWESFVITVVANPLPGVDQALVIAGSDKRGTIYGIYELSEQIGVSPWYWWADVPPGKRSSIHVLPGPFASGEPAVKYRGIFLNDEAPALNGWTNVKFGGRNRQFYTKVFELLLRLRGNYLWPAMWGDAFNEDDPENPRLADEYGIVMGTSHHEPMLRAKQEWTRHRTEFGNAEWNYQTNADGLQAFWRAGVARNKNYESIVTIGMRGDGDLPMVSGGDMATNRTLLETIVADQRQILTEETGKPAPQTPQLWALYKEVMDYYDSGMRVPDDVTLLWCDDNWGNIRRLPGNAEERGRSGGSGVYYHFDYVGGPRSYKWLNTYPLPKIHEQMNLAWQCGADRIWIVNVGDLKPMEVPMEFFLRMAWNPARWQTEQLDDYLLTWAAREFGASHAAEVAALVAGYTKLNGLRKPELLDPSTFSLHHYREAERILARWQDLATRAEALHTALPAEFRDAFHQLVRHPVLACANLNDLYITTARNRLHATQSRASTNDTAARATALFQYDADLTTSWNTSFANGKWIHLMDQTHIGYTTWSDPPANVMPALSSYSAPAVSELGVALEGSETALLQGETGVLPPLHSEGGATSRRIELFRRGTLATSWSITANHPWVTITPASGTLGNDAHAEIGIDWPRAPTGSGEVLLTIRGGTATSSRTIRLPFSKAPAAPETQPIGFLDPEGFIAIEAPNFDRKVQASGMEWKVLPDHGRSLGGVTPLPATAASIATPGGTSPRLEYDVYLRRKGELPVRLILSPSMAFIPGQPLRCAISLDDQTPQVLTVSTTCESAAWADAVRDSVRTATASLLADAAGHHVLKFWMVDPGVVIQRLEIDTGGIRPSYMGPPESPRGRRAPAVPQAGEQASPSVSIEAESGTLGAEMTTFLTTVPAYISAATNGGGSAPTAAARVARYQLTFPTAGNYRLYARVRVGAAGANDDSFFIGNGFGVKNPANNADWRTINNFFNTGYTTLTDTVRSMGGTAGTGVWKWIDASAHTGITFTVPTGQLIQTLDVGVREDGLDLDKFVLAPATHLLTVDDLNQGTGGSPPAASMHVLEAEGSAYGAGFSLTSGNPVFLTTATNGLTMPGTSARVMRFAVNFAAAGDYRLYARVSVGPGSANDDSLFVGRGFGAKDPAAATDWAAANNFANTGYAGPAEVVAPSNGGTTGPGTWKWIDLSAIAGITFTVLPGLLAQTLDLGGREDGLALDKIVFAPAGRAYTVDQLDSGIIGAPPSTAPVFTAVLDETRQIIDGFGASSAWNWSLSDAEADQFFSPVSGLGLSLLRVRIAPDGTTSETGIALKAITRGASVWATPWSPPAEWKSNNDVNNGGSLLPQHWSDWALRLADFATNMQSVGIPLLALSAQNEPDYAATWESCVWSPQDLAGFIRDHLGPALAARGLATRVLAAENIGWNSLAAYSDALLADPGVLSSLSHIATHSYSGVPFIYPSPATHGKKLWQTEFTDSGASSDPGMDSALRVASDVHDFLTITEGNAWHYWWLRQDASSASTSALTELGTLAKRGWALGNWSRFVRPGHRRTLACGSNSQIRATAFISPTSHDLSIVAINLENTARMIPLAISGGSVSSLTPWETSATRSLTALPAIIPAGDNSFTLDLPARSITTFVANDLVVGQPAGYAQWAAALPPEARAPELDPDGDGIPNLAACLLGALPGNPLAPDRRPRISSTAGVWHFTFPMADPMAVDLSCHIDRSDDLVAWNEIATKRSDSPWAGETPVESLTTEDGSLIARVVVSCSQNRVFYRLRVSRDS